MVSVKTKKQIDLTPFCCHDSRGRFAINKPFVRGGWRYATDGAVMVRVPAPGEPDTKEKVPTNLEALMAAGKGKWLPFPSVGTCGACGSACSACGGNGVRLGAVHISGHYMAIINSLPNVTYQVQPVFDKPLRFRFKGGEGAVMGLSREAA